tara:strand:- start:172 stop:2187 length:2016 start_codon:yes stop_codon:yes gene_type:complete
LPKERILIVDDEKNIVSSLQGILADEGYEVTCAEDGLEALDMIQSDPPDLVILDIWIPGMDGIEALSAIRTYNQEIGVLIMSGHASIDTAVKATKLGANDFIEKPFSYTQLIQAVENVFQEKKKTSLGPDRELTDPVELLLCFKMMVEVKKRVKNASLHNKPVLILGEKGTGKEIFAQTIHRQSQKSDYPFIKLNCAVRKPQDIQSILFAPKNPTVQIPRKMTGAYEKVIYLSNIESMGKTLQEKLALALKGQTVKKNESVLNFLPSRIFASSTLDLETLRQNGMLREDLLELCEESLVTIPPLREHSSEIPAIIHRYFQESIKDGSVPPKIEDTALKILCSHSWPGNMKELRSTLDQVLSTTSSRDIISLCALPAAMRVSKPRTQAIKKDIERFSQRTLKRSVVLCGSGLHSGIKTGMILQPMPPGSGIIFGDISSGDTIPAKLENVESTHYSTCLKKGLTSVATIEHIMAVLHMYRITNLLIKIGDEAPVMDGSAKDFCQLLEDGEFEEQNGTYEEIIIDRHYNFGEPDSGKPFITIEPDEKFVASYHMEYPLPIGVQSFTYEFAGKDSFKTQIAPARTFGFLEDVAQLTKMGFASGGKLDNFILLGDEKVLNTKLRYEDEFACHKILDIIGDFFLLGRPVRGRIKAHKSGHTENIGLLKQIQRTLCNR